MLEKFFKVTLSRRRNTATIGPIRFYGTNKRFLWMFKPKEKPIMQKDFIINNRIPNTAVPAEKSLEVLRLLGSSEKNLRKVFSESFDFKGFSARARITVPNKAIDSQHYSVFLKNKLKNPLIAYQINYSRNFNYLMIVAAILIYIMIQEICSAQAEEGLNKDDKDRLVLAFRSFLRGDIEESLKHIVPLIEKYPKLELVQELIEKKKFKEALEILDKVFVDDFDSKYPYKIIKGMVFSSLGKYQEALALIEEAIEQDNSYIRAIAYYQKGVILSDMGKNDEAKKFFQEAIYDGKNIATLEKMVDSHKKIISLLKNHSAVSLKNPKNLEFKLPNKGDIENYVIIRVWRNPNGVGHTSLQTARHYISLWPSDPVDKSQLHEGKPPSFLNYSEDVKNEKKKADMEVCLYGLDVDAIDFYFEAIREIVSQWKIHGTLETKLLSKMLGDIPIFTKNINDSEHSCASLVFALLNIGGIKTIISPVPPDKIGLMSLQRWRALKGVTGQTLLGTVTYSASCLAASPFTLFAKLTGNKAAEEIAINIVKNGTYYPSVYLAWILANSSHTNWEEKDIAELFNNLQNQNPYLLDDHYKNIINRFQYPSDTLELNVPTPEDIYYLSHVAKIFDVMLHPKTKEYPNSYDSSVHITLDSTNEVKLQADGLWGWTSMHYAIRYDQLTQFIELRQKYPRECRRKTGRGQKQGRETLYHLAIRYDAKGCFNYLMNENIIDINDIDQNGDSPVIYAVKSKKSDFVAALLDAKANPAVHDQDYMNALHWAVKMDDIKAFEELSSRFPALIKSVCKYGDSVMHLALEHSPKIFESLIKPNNQLVHHKNQFGKTVLFCAVEKNDLNAVKNLVGVGADINTATESQKTLLHVTNNIECINFLASKGANVDAKDNHGNTPLHVMVSEGDVSLVNCLLENGASVHYKNNEGKTPIEMASKNKSEIEKLFEAHTKVNQSKNTHKLR